MSAPRRIRIFVSSPSDLNNERDHCGAVVQELNTTLRALLPEKAVELELIRWETHTHPDLTGEPQQVVDDQIETDYDIFVGMMWTRFGTSTSRTGSGTEHEFGRSLPRLACRALLHREALHHLSRGGCPARRRA